MATYHKFVSNIPSSKYVFKDGSIAVFVAGQYLTDDDDYAAELNKEIKLKHPHISVDPNALTVTSESLDPLASLRKKFFEEFKAAQAAAVDPSNDMGNSVQGKLAGMSTSRGVDQITAPSKSK